MYTPANHHTQSPKKRGENDPSVGHPRVRRKIFNSAHEITIGTNTQESNNHTKECYPDSFSNSRLITKH